MATNRRSKTKEITGVEVSPRSSLRLRSRGVQHENIGDVPSSGMSLDVLAQVASETLENEPDSPQKIIPKKLSMRTIQSLEVLTLEQILGLNEKNLLSLFSEVESNEMRRNFTYMCYLMPKQCQKQFTSFGSEMRAKTEIKKHLYQHLDELKKEAASPGRKTKFKFTAEPVQVRKRRIYDMLLPPAKKKKHKPVEHSTPEVKNPPAAEDSDDSDSVPVNLTEALVKEENIDETEINTVTSLVHKSLQKVGGKQVPLLHKMGPEKPEELKLENLENDSALGDEAERRIEENEQFIIDLLSKTQPHHDHNYTTIFGSRKGSEVIHHLVDESDEEKEDATGSNNTVIYLDKKGNKTKHAVKPILFLRHRSPNENVPMVSKEEVIDDHEIESDGEDDVTRLLTKGTYLSNWEPWQKSKSQPIRNTGLTTYYRVGLVNAFQQFLHPEEVNLYKQQQPTQVNKSGRKKKNKEVKKDDSLCVKELEKKKDNAFLQGMEGKEMGWEAKLAMKFIKELKGKKKFENIPLVCKICRDKTFTATATLMYHYRSHAGIKPFVCLICKTTFTRQHSLNYHMLIHNNQSRFTCKDCGRKFRHPSHFKEHLRRHTGETPFKCADCGQKFKTRNTYKRHLKTRHGKLLTASGISQMTREEFLKVRTKPYKIPRLADISYTMPELTFTKLKRSELGRRRRQHVDSDEAVDVAGEPINVAEILKTVDEIKEEIESNSDTESVTTESAGGESLSSSGGQELAQKIQATQSSTESQTESDTLNILESVCADVLSGNNGKLDGPQMQFKELTLRPAGKTKKPREKISIEIVEGDKAIDGSSTSVTVPAINYTELNAGSSDSANLPVGDIQICVPVKVPVNTNA